LNVTSSDKGGISSKRLLLGPLSKARLNDLEITSKKPEWIVYTSKEVSSSTAVK